MPLLLKLEMQFIRTSACVAYPCSYLPNGCGRYDIPASQHYSKPRPHCCRGNRMRCLRRQSEYAVGFAFAVRCCTDAKEQLSRRRQQPLDRRQACSGGRIGTGWGSLSIWWQFAKRIRLQRSRAFLVRQRWQVRTADDGGALGRTGSGRITPNPDWRPAVFQHFGKDVARRAVSGARPLRSRAVDWQGGFGRKPGVGLLPECLHPRRTAKVAAHAGQSGLDRLVLNNKTMQLVGECLACFCLGSCNKRQWHDQRRHEGRAANVG